MTLEEKLHALISELIAAFLPGGIELIFSGENGKRPPKDYISMTVSGKEKFPVHRGETDAAGNRELLAHQSFELQLLIYGKLSMKIADAMAMMLETELSNSRIEELNLAWSSEPKTENVPALLDDLTYEPRALLRIEGQHTLAITEFISFIDTVNGAATGSGGQTVTTIDFTATVNNTN